MIKGHTPTTVQAFEACLQNYSQQVAICAMSHDIRTPVTGILGMAKILKQNAENKENQRDADLLIAAAEELLKLLDATVVKSEVLDFDLTELIQHNVALISPALRHKKLRIQVHISPQLSGRFFGQKLLLDRILLNLLSNAVKFTHEGHITIEAHLVEETGEQWGVELVVADTGMGIQPERLPYLFEDFSQPATTAQGIYQNTGLGLYTIKKYVKLLQGDIKVSSTLNRGTRFVLAFNLKRAATATTASPLMEQILVDNGLAEYIPLPAAQKRSVLLVEDQLAAARGAISILMDAGYEVDHAVSGAAALQYVQQKSYDLICLDLKLADQNGFEIAQVIRRLTHRNARVPLIALSGSLNNQECTLGKSAGFQAMLLKPLTSEKMQWVETHLVKPEIL